MKYLLLFLLLPSLTSAQKGFFTIEGSANFPESIGSGFGIEGSGNGKIVNGLYGGFSISAIKFANANKGYFPICGKITILPTQHTRGTFPFIVLQPGFGAYYEKIGAFTTSGAFTFYGGVGLVAAGSGKGRATISVGYSSFGFTVPSTTVDNYGNVRTGSSNQIFYNGLAAKFGLRLN